MKFNKMLFIGGVICSLASLLHVAIIIGGPNWYRFFGAGESMAQLAENDPFFPALITVVIAAVLAIWAIYAFAGAGIMNRPPLLKSVLFVISAIFIARGLFGIPLVIYMDHPYLNELQGRMIFMFFSSLISLGIGLFYLIGLIQVGNYNFRNKNIMNP